MNNQKLNVYLNQTLTGELSISADGDMSFFYDSAYITDKNNHVLSQSLPLQTKPFNAKECRPYLLVKLYDRIEKDKDIQRLHQEDFCQAIGVIPEMKYQREGGIGITECFELVRAVSSLPILDIKALLQGILFHLIIGNNDAHGKNFSLLYQKNQTRLAPWVAELTNY